MMRTHGGAWTVVLVLGASVALGTVPDARAELDYEFAKGLLDWQDNNNFHSTDLVERLIAKLAKSPNKDQQLEAKLILAKLKRRQAESASAEKRNALLTEADNLYKEFLKDGAKHRLAKECDAEQATIQKDYALALIKAAQENPALNKENRAKAVDIYKKIADLMEADKAQFREPLKKALADLDKWQNDNPDAENLPPHLIAPAQKALEGFVIRDKKYVIARLEQVEAYPEGEEQKMAARALIKYCDELVGSEDIGMIDTVCMWYHFIKGRLHALILEEKEATEAWRSALEVQPDNPDPDVKRTVLDVRKLIYGDLVKMKMRGAEKNPEKYNEIIDIVGSALYEPSMKSYWEQPHGKLLLMDYAFALIRQPEASANEYEQAIKQLRKIVEGGPPWSNNASRTMAQIIREGRSKKPPIRPPPYRGAVVRHRARILHRGAARIQEIRREQGRRRQTRAGVLRFGLGEVQQCGGILSARHRTGPQPRAHAGAHAHEGRAAGMVRDGLELL
ncbi:MAG: hypothetical protein M5U26_17920 [Planctomycetota bacterium]|nr:hypothetical protein [Planctomycetota bacterium]